RPRSRCAAELVDGGRGVDQGDLAALDLREGVDQVRELVGGDVGDGILPRRRPTRRNRRRCRSVLRAGGLAAAGRPTKPRTTWGMTTTRERAERMIDGAVAEVVFWRRPALDSTPPVRSVRAARR